MSAVNDTYMRMCLELARKGEGFVEPNPYVGCVIVKGGKIIGTGYHRKFGALHAEREALKSCKVNPRGATMYVNLEPCCHYGKTPPCTDAIIAAGIKKVVIGCLDPNPLVRVKGVKLLHKAGIETTVVALEKESRRLNESFFHWIRTGRPYVTMKLAISADGFIAKQKGKPVHMTSKASDAKVHALRNKNQAILVGSQTVINDNPRLTARVQGKKTRDPLRIIIDSRMRVSLKSHVFDDNNYLLVGSNNSQKHVNLDTLMEFLGKNNISSVLLEGGAHLIDAMVAKGLVQRCHLVFTTTYLKKGIRWSYAEKRCILHDIETETVGPDMWITGTPKK